MKAQVGQKEQGGVIRVIEFMYYGFIHGGKKDGKKIERKVGRLRSRAMPKWPCVETFQ